MIKKEVQIHMLPTEDKTNILKVELGNIEELRYVPTLRFQDLEESNYKIKTYQHLYITTDEEIKEGDWVLGLDNIIIKTNTSNCVSIQEHWRKIIATTDTKLIEPTYKGWTKQLNSNYLPQPSQVFVEKYCRVGGIDEVLVEYYSYFTDEAERLEGINDGETIQKELRLKVNSDNEIVIHTTKDSWNREEVEVLLKRFIQFYRDRPDQSKTLSGIGKWIKENLYGDNMK